MLWPKVRFLLMRWGWGLGQKPNYKASDTWESWGLNDEMHFSTSIIPNAKIFLLLRNITSYTATTALPALRLEGSGLMQGDSLQFGWYANKAKEWDFVTSKMQRTYQMTKNHVKMSPAPWVSSWQSCQERAKPLVCLMRALNIHRVLLLNSMGLSSIHSL